MRMLMKMKMPVAEGNEAISSGRFGKVMERLFERIQPEATYFLAEGGSRCAYIAFDLKQLEDIPLICEPLFRELHAEIEATPAMNLEDVQKGIQRDREVQEQERPGALH